MLKQSAMTRPLFEEPSDGIERTEPFSGPKGFMFGGMCSATKQQLGQHYFEAADLLIRAIKRNELEDYKLAHPVFFLYRHSIELTLKSLIEWMESPDVWGHNLASLADRFETAVQRKFGQEVPSWIIDRIKEIAVMDPGSTTFRYDDAQNDGEMYVSLVHLQEVMKGLNSALCSVWVHLLRESAE
ncbi:MAG TPA: hypothetical protein VGR97_02775 [Candidatus Acidoferrales bacterium]|nr:hypothetical protein [Candidatus Acidoferrales bacterium]